MKSIRPALLLAITLLAAACGGGGSDPPPPLPAGSVALSSAAYSVSQSTGLLTVTVNRADGSRESSVDYATSDGSALAGTDYTARNGKLSWASGDSSPKTLSLTIGNATPNTVDKTFRVTLSNAANGMTLGTPASATVTITVGGSVAAPAVSVRANRLVDASGNVLQLRGISFSGFEFVAIGGWSPSDPSGGQAGQPNGPRWSAVKAWRANAVRFTLNETSWLGLTCVDTDGVARLGDPGGNYRAAVSTQVQQANAAGLYVILELHWAAPGNACPMVQTQMANTDHSLDFWTSVASAFKSNSSVIFSLYNEPFFFGLAAGQNEWSALMNGGTFDYFPATSGTSNYRNVATPWRSAGMQALLEAVRATGATNVVLIGGVHFSNDLSQWLAHRPRDPLNQVAASWHPYPPMQRPTTVGVASGGAGYAVGDTITLVKPNTVYAPAVLRVSSVGTGGAVTAATLNVEGRYLQTALPATPVSQGATSGTGTGATFALGGWGNLSSPWSMPVNWPVVQALSQQVPIVFAETGEHNAPGTVGAPFLQALLPFANANNWSVIGCCWNVFAERDNVLIKDVDGTPSDGYGRVFHDWMIGAAWQ
jgi:hypothetical protein